LRRFHILSIVGLAASLAACQPAKTTTELRAKVGQLFLLAFAGTDPSVVLPFIQQRGIGGLYLSNDNLRTPEQSARLLKTLQDGAMRGIAKLPLLTACDQEGAWGVMVPHSSTGPGNMALGAAPVEQTQEMYSVFSRELSSVGVFVDLAPASDVNSNALNPIIGTRSFGEHPDAVAARVKAAIAGLHAGGTIATAKHFPGHGNTRSDSHTDIPRVSRPIEEIEAVDLVPVRAAVDAGVDMVMTAHIIYDALDKEHPATLSRTILQDYLRKKLGFQGVIITDSFNMGAIHKNYDPPEAAIQALLAGADMIMLAEERYGVDVGDYVKSQTRMLDRVEDAVRSGRIPMARIDEAYGRIRALKTKYQLASRAGQPAAPQVVGSSANRDIAERSADAAVTRIYDRARLLPLKRGAKVAVVRLTKEDIAEIVAIGKGIGPNYANAYPDFVAALKAEGFDVAETGFDLQAAPGRALIAVGENYPFPGKSLDLVEQRRRLATLQERNPGRRVVYVGLKDPYDANLVSPDAYLSALGSNIFNVHAVARALVGRIAPAGTLPVTPLDGKPGDKSQR
jgi:beta-N-acetylhexosaminidase